MSPNEPKMNPEGPAVTKMQSRWEASTEKVGTNSGSWGRQLPFPNSKQTCIHNSGLLLMLSHACPFSSEHRWARNWKRYGEQDRNPIGSMRGYTLRKKQRKMLRGPKSIANLIQHKPNLGDAA